MILSTNHSKTETMNETSSSSALRLRHDIRNALAPALLSAEILDAHPDPDVQCHARTIDAAITHVIRQLGLFTEAATATAPNQAPETL